jgi:hypothetical protein
LRKLGRYVEYSVFGSDVTVDWSIISDDKELDVIQRFANPQVADTLGRLCTDTSDRIPKFLLTAGRTRATSRSLAGKDQQHGRDNPAQIVEPV